MAVALNQTLNRHTLVEQYRLVKCELVVKKLYVPNYILELNFLNIHIAELNLWPQSGQSATLCLVTVCLYNICDRLAMSW